MKSLAAAHSKCYHARLRPGVVYCCESRALYVDTALYLEAKGHSVLSMAEAVAFMAAAQTCHKALPEGSIDAYVWMTDGKEMPGMLGKCHSLVELTVELKRRGK